MAIKDMFANSINLMVDKFLLGIPTMIAAAVVLGIGFMLSKMIFKTIKVFLEKMGIDRFGEKLNEIDIVDKSGIKIKISTVFAKLIYYMLLLIFIVLATDILQMPALSQLVSDAINLFPNIIIAIVLIIVGLLGAEALRKTLLTTLTSLGIPSAKIISMLAFYFVFITVFVMALTQAKINTAFLAQNISIILGGIVFAFSLGYGLASKEVVSNFLASLYSKERIKVGDTIKLKDIQGKIAEVDKSTVIVETHDAKVVIPLSKLLSDSFEIKN